MSNRTSHNRGYSPFKQAALTLTLAPAVRLFHLPCQSCLLVPSPPGLSAPITCLSHCHLPLQVCNSSPVSEKHKYRLLVTSSTLMPELAVLLQFQSGAYPRKLRTPGLLDILRSTGHWNVVPTGSRAAQLGNCRFVQTGPLGKPRQPCFKQEDHPARPSGEQTRG